MVVKKKTKKHNCRGIFHEWKIVYQDVSQCSTRFDLKCKHCPAEREIYFDTQHDDDLVEEIYKDEGFQRIISGGQSGADHGGLIAGKHLGLDTGGWMPKGFRREEGYMPSMQKKYGMKEHSSAQYPPRTALNVKESDATLIVGNVKSPGSKMTVKMCRQYDKPFFMVDMLDYSRVKEFKVFIKQNEVRCLNVAGNRESKKVGIRNFTKMFLIKALE